jgi:peroxiredoxin
MAQHAAAFIDALGITRLDALGFSMGGLIAQQVTLDRPDRVRKLVLVGTGPRSGEGMASFTPEAQEIFGAKYDPADELWLRVLFTPSKPSQAAGRKYLERQRARTENRDPLPNDKVAPAPMILVLSRGGYCPKDLRQAQGLVQLHREMEVGYARLVTISTDNMIATNEYRTGVGAHWLFLSDPGRKVQKDLDIAEYTDSEHDPMIPHVIVLEPGLVIFKIYNGYWFVGRPTIEELRQDLRAVLRKCRPDWDITAAELKSDWERGERGHCYPYGKTYGQIFHEQE